MYPKEDKENYQVLQFASQAAGSQGLATYVQQISEAAIKVILLPMRQTMRSGDCTLRSSDGHHPCERHARWCRPLCVCCYARTRVSPAQSQQHCSSPSEIKCSIGDIIWAVWHQNMCMSAIWRAHS